MNNMKIYLLNPPFLKRYSRQSRSPSVTKSNTLYYPYYLAYTTGWLENHGFECKLVDAIANDWKPYQVIEDIKEFKPELIVIDTSTASIYEDAFTAKTIKDNFPNVKIILTGTFPTNMPEYTLNLNDSIDFVAIGEYDNTILDLARAMNEMTALDSVKGIAFRIGNKIIKTGEARLLTEKELSEQPFVSKIYLKHFGRKGIENYFYASTMWPMLMILTARGCYWNCSFCNIPMKKSYRSRSIDSVIEEFKFIQKEMPFVREVMIEDDTFNQNRMRTLDLCSRMIDEGIHLTWSCNARVSTEFEVLELMVRAGCRLTCVGFESATTDILTNIEKRTTLDQQKKFMSIANELGLKVNGCFIFGLPNDNEETMNKTIQLAKDLNPNSAQFYPAQAYPGTELYHWAEQNHLLTTTNFREWITKDGLHSTTIKQGELTPKEVLNFCNKARLEFYSNPKFLLKMIGQALMNPGEANRIFKASIVLGKHLLNHSKGEN